MPSSNRRRYAISKDCLRAESSDIRPFHVNFSDAEVSDLRRRVTATKWPSRETVTDASQGVQLATTQKLARYWSTDYDWRKCEAKVNALPQSMTTIDGVDIHFIHVRSEHANAMPKIVTHGWPGSTFEQMKIIDPLTSPRRMAGAHRTRSTSSFRRCWVTAFQASRQRPAGIRSASRARGSC